MKSAARGGSRYSQRSFATAPSANIRRSRFDRSYPVSDTHQFDYLNPIFCEEILPGDSVSLEVNSFMRLATQVVPLMDNMYVDFFFFFVPNRLLWDNWERFMGANDPNPSSSTDYLTPLVSPPTDDDTFKVGSMADKFGIPTGVANLDVIAFPFRAYNLIWKEWFRDENLQVSPAIRNDDGPDAYGDYPLRKRARPHDYFSSALPWPQKGDPVSMPILGQAPVYGLDLEVGAGPTPPYYMNPNMFQALQNSTGTKLKGFLGVNSAASPGDRNVFSSELSDSTNFSRGLSLGSEADYANFTPGTNGYYPQPPYAELDGNVLATINGFRQAMLVQQLLERDARGGTRYVELIKSHFGVTNPDFRLQRPEFLSSSSTQIMQHPVAQTSGPTEAAGFDTTPQANLAAFSTQAEASGKVGFNKSFTEHGWVIGLMQARGQVKYQQGLQRSFSRRTRFDYFWPELQGLGEQAVLNKEIYAQGPAVTDPDGVPYDDLPFGYIERYGEYRFHPAEIRGQFRSTFAQTLDVWHLAEEFQSLPTLGNSFIQQNTPIDRSLVLPDVDYPHLLCDFYFKFYHTRPMAVYGTPAKLGRF